MRKGIALLITIFFVIAITLSIGLGFRYIKDAKESVSDEQFILQTSTVVEDLLTILKDSQQLKDIKDAQNLSTFLAESSFIPLNYKDTQITIEISSARAKLNLNIFKNKERLDVLKSYFQSNMIVVEFADILTDSMNGIKEDLSYKSDIFNNNPTLFRNYITSYEHLDKLNQIYKNKYHDNHIKNIEIDKLFFLSKDSDTKVDLNFVTSEVWEFMLGCSALKAEALSANNGSYKTIEDLNLNDAERKMLNKFKYSFYEPYLNIKLTISQNKKHQTIEFSYDLI